MLFYCCFRITNEKQSCGTFDTARALFSQAPLTRGLLTPHTTQVAQEEMETDREWVDHLSKRMYDAVMKRIPDVTLNGDEKKRYPGNLNFSFAYVEVRALRSLSLRKQASTSVRACMCIVCMHNALCFGFGCTIPYLSCNGVLSTEEFLQCLPPPSETGIFIEADVAPSVCMFHLSYCRKGGDGDDSQRKEFPLASPPSPLLSRSLPPTIFCRSTILENYCVSVFFC